jgi:hypothetical protein
MKDTLKKLKLAGQEGRFTPLRFATLKLVTLKAAGVNHPSRPANCQLLSGPSDLPQIDG